MQKNILYTETEAYSEIPLFNIYTYIFLIWSVSSSKIHLKKSDGKAIDLEHNHLQLYISSLFHTQKLYFHLRVIYFHLHVYVQRVFQGQHLPGRIFRRKVVGIKDTKPIYFALCTTLTLFCHLFCCSCCLFLILHKRR